MSQDSTPPREAPRPEGGYLDEVIYLRIRELSKQVEDMKRIVEGLAERSQAWKPERLLKVSDLAERWDVSTRTIESMASAGEVVSTYIRGSHRFSVAAVEAYERQNVRSRPKRSVRRATKPPISHDVVHSGTLADCCPEMGQRAL